MLEQLTSDKTNHFVLSRIQERSLTLALQLRWVVQKLLTVPSSAAGLTEQPPTELSRQRNLPCTVKTRPTYENNSAWIESRSPPFVDGLNS